MNQPKNRGLMLTVPADIHRNLRLLAAERDTTIAALVRTALENYLAEQGEQAKVKSA